MTRLAWVDVFAAGPMTGMPLAVILDAEQWSTERMLRLAAELGLPEMAVVLDAGRGRPPLLRVFSPQDELSDSGHAAVGAAWVLHAAGRMGEAGELATASGPLTVRVGRGVATVEQAPPRAGPDLDAAEAAAAIGATAAEWPPAQVWGAGRPQLMLPVSDAQALREARPDREAMGRLAARDGWVGVTAYAILAAERERLQVAVRHFALGSRTTEGAMVGAGAGALGARLASAGLVDPHGALAMVVSSRAPGGRGGEIAVRVKMRDGSPERVQVGGRVVPLFEGRLLPG